MVTRKYIICKDEYKMQKVGFVSVYLGEIPHYFNNFICSCSWNQSYDFHVFLDHPYTDKIATNVFIHYVNQSEILKRVEDKLNIIVDESEFSSYKLCDYKPTYGVLFDDYLVEYDFWGMLDIDLILGDLSYFINDSLLSNFDKIFTLGHMSLIRNTPETNRLFMTHTENSQDYLDVYNTPKNCIFDEINGITEKFVDKGYKVYFKKDYVDAFISGKRFVIVDRFCFKLLQPQSRYSSYCPINNYKYQIFILDHGKIKMLYFHNGEVKEKEFAYFHKTAFDSLFDITKQSRLIISTQGLIEDDLFFSKVDSSDIKMTDLNKYNKYKPFYEAMQRIYMYFRLNIRCFRKKYFPREDEILFHD